MTKISPMKWEHLAEVSALGSQLGYPAPMKELEERFGQIEKLGYHALFVYVDGKVLGWVHLEEVSDLIEEVKVELKALIVDENYRGRGVGKALVEKAKNWTRERRRNTLYLNCNLKRERAHAFYQREGFRLLKTSHFFEIQV